mmetsp:Transcript_20564/g.52189  ORF Transcript_20564/g.52189 Transcript_20564/m.52189 type:complete len:247 (-) Transcript_20564:13-753(-)
MKRLGSCSPKKTMSGLTRPSCRRTISRQPGSPCATASFTSSMGTRAPLEGPVTTLAVSKSHARRPTCPPVRVRVMPTHLVHLVPRQARLERVDVLRVAAHEQLLLIEQLDEPVRGRGRVSPWPELLAEAIEGRRVAPEEVEVEYRLGERQAVLLQVVRLPVPGVRKSGMPAETLIPAPVRTTTRRHCPLRRSSATFSIVTPLPPIGASPAAVVLRPAGGGARPRGNSAAVRQSTACGKEHVRVLAW